jgi:hypothetical protein
MSSTAGSFAQVFFQTETDPVFSGDKAAAFTVIPDGHVRDYLVDLGTSSNYQGVVTRWRLDPTDQPGANLRVEEFCAEEDPYLASATAVSATEIDVVFNQAMLPDGEVVNPANYVLTGLGQGTAAATPDLVSVRCSPDGLVYRLTWTNGAMNGGGVSLAAANADDPRGNVLWVGSGAVLDSVNGLAREASEFTDVEVGPATVSLSGTGTTGGLYHVVSSPDLAAPVAGWPPVLTNAFGADGSFADVLSRKPGDPARFYGVRQP